MTSNGFIFYLLYQNPKSTVSTKSYCYCFVFRFRTFSVCCCCCWCFVFCVFVFHCATNHMLLVASSMFIECFSFKYTSCALNVLCQVDTVNEHNRMNFVCDVCHCQWRSKSNDAHRIKFSFSFSCFHSRSLVQWNGLKQYRLLFMHLKITVHENVQP